MSALPPLVAAVLRAVRAGGTHALSRPLRAGLAAARDHGRPDPREAAFLDAVLGRHDGRFVNRAYLALPLLERLLPGLGPDRLTALLMADVLRHETTAGPAGLDARTHARRLRYARHVHDAALDGAGPVTADPATLAWLAATALPVSTQHDERFFLRALQAHEMTFTVAVDGVRAATADVRAGDLAAAPAALERATAAVRRSALLFPLVGTMRPAAFHAFRVHTDGASAIQSDQYKRFEAACADPHPRRLRTDAYAGVPVVRAEVRAGQDTLTRALLERRAADPAHPGWPAVLAAARALADRHDKWRTAHIGLATRMLGEDAPGSGATAGVPYLRDAASAPLLRHLPAGRGGCPFSAA